MMRYENLTRKPELFRAPVGPGPSPGTMYPLDPPLTGPDRESLDTFEHFNAFLNSIFK